MKAGTVARRDAILCAVRDGGMVSTHEVCRAICATCSEQGATSYHCYPQVYQDLRALAKAGLIHWQRSEKGHPAMFFLSMEARSRFETYDLEALWVAG